MGPTSVIQRVKNSDHLQRLFQQSIGQNPENVELSHIRNMSNAKHRFDSALRPLIRLIVLFDEICLLAKKVCILRQGNDIGKDFQNFIEFMSGQQGIARALLIGLMAEAGEISLEFIRFLDTEAYEVSDLNFALAQWARRTQVLFMQRQAFVLPATWAKMLHDKLTRPKVFHVNGTPYQIGWAGALPRASVDAAYTHAHAWVALAISVIHAEFPSWSILQSFAIFNPDRICSITGIDQDACLPRLARLFNLPMQALQCQYDALLPAAVRKLSEPDCACTFGAWRDVLLACGGRHRELREVVLRLGTWSGMTTSGVEHVHNMQDWLLDRRRGSLSDGVENDEMKLVSDMKPNEIDAVCELAATVWAHFYGNPRETDFTKVHGNTGKLRTSTKRSLVGLARERQDSVSKACRLTGDGSVATTLGDMQREAVASAATIWDASMSAELQFNRDKGTANRMVGIRENYVLDSETMAGDVPLEAQMREHKISLRDGRLRAAERKRAATEKLELNIGAGMRVYVHSAGAERCSQSALDACNSMHLTLVHSTMLADVVVTSNPGRMHESMNWALFLKGGIVCTEKFFVDGEGAALRFRGCVTVGGNARKPRYVWLSNRFQVEHAEKCSAMRQAMGLPISNWAELPRAQWVVHGARAAKASNLSAIGVVAESQADDVSGDRLMFTPTQLYQKFVHIAHTSVGACRH